VPRLFGVGRVVEQRAQPDAAAVELRVARRPRVARVEVRRRVVGREEDEGAQELEDVVDVPLVEGRSG